MARTDKLMQEHSAPKWWQDQRLLDRESETVKAIMRGDYGGYVLARPDALKDHDS